MKLTRIFLLVAVLATAGLCSARAVLAASETPLDFVHALAGSDYADIAVDYLNDLKKENRLPPDLAMSGTWRCPSACGKPPTMRISPRKKKS